ncbi:MAG TPA: NifB/NifX family molybdenum-iron cluster-binding protein [Bacteroidales bacterium]|nr:NifB/NifX family molybdenum-iron cluster-binding protein [Bacteroidales bacterium]
MKIAVPTRNNRVDGHFGHCEVFSVFTTDENNQVLHTEEVPSFDDCGCKSGIAEILKEKGVSLMLAGNMGPGALNKLNATGIEVIRGCSGEISQVVEEYLRGSLVDSGVACNHHDDHGGHDHHEHHHHRHH